MAKNFFRHLLPIMTIGYSGRFILTIIVALGLTACAGGGVTDEQRHLEVEETWGIRILGIRLTANNYMLDFRYRVVDPEKAAPITDRTIKPHVIVERTGVELPVPVTKLGPLRQYSDTPKANQIYATLFANPGNIPGGRVKAGDLLTVVVGNFKAEHIVVQ